MNQTPVRELVRLKALVTRIVKYNCDIIGLTTFWIPHINCAVFLNYETEGGVMNDLTAIDLTQEMSGGGTDGQQCNINCTASCGMGTGGSNFGACGQGQSDGDTC